MTPPAKKAGSRDTPKTTSYTVAGHPAPGATIPEHVRDLLQTTGVGDSIDLHLTRDEVAALRDQGVIA